jgi:hypothetical protein
MALVVEADAQDLAGIRNDRQELDLVELEVRFGALHCGRERAERSGCDRLPQTAAARGEPARELDDAAVDDGTELGHTRMAKTD